MGGHTYLHYLLPPHTPWFHLYPGVKGAASNYAYTYACVPCKHGGVLGALGSHLNLQGLLPLDTSMLLRGGYPKGLVERGEVTYAG